MARYDVIVVGAGASGSPLAARLSEDPRVSVLLLEAGPAPTSVDGFPAEVLDAGSLRGADPGHPLNWSYPALLAPGRPYSIARGRILGGSTSINAGYFVRARRDDFERWSRAGGVEWSWSSVLPLYRALEADAQFGDTALHGAAGAMRVSRPATPHPADRAFAAACAELGLPLEPDKNGEQPPGFGPVPLAVVDGVRLNAGMAYVLPALGRRNLTVRGGAVVRRVLFDGTTAVAVELLGDAGDEVVELAEGGQIVLSAGSIATPHLLLLSGVGPREQLRAAGVAVVHDSPGVGASFSDHPSVTVAWRADDDLVDTADGRTIGSALNLTSATATTVGDLEVLLVLKPTGYLLTGRLGDDRDLSFICAVQAETSRGSIRLASADPLEPPLVDYGYLATPHDRSALRAAVRAAAAVVASRAFAAIGGRLTDLDAATLGDDDALDAWCRDRLGTSIHLCGSAPFGADDDPLAVLDRFGRVRGVRALRVADTSMLPDAPSRGPAATAVLIGELVARFVRRGD